MQHNAIPNPAQLRQMARDIDQRVSAMLAQRKQRCFHTGASKAYKPSHGGYPGVPQPINARPFPD